MNWLQINRLRLSEIRRAKRLIKTALNEQQEHFLSSIGRANSFSDLNNAANFKLNVVPMETAYVNIYKQTGTKFAKYSRRKLKTKKSDEEDIVYTRFESHMQTFAKIKAGKRIVDVTGTTFEEIQRITAKAITEATKEGWSIFTTARQIEKDLKISNLYRAERIARTEVLSASNEGSLVGAQSLEIPFKKVWIATPDSRIRDSHLSLNGQSVGQYESFSNGLEYPGDTNGQAEEVINCRCVIGYDVD